MKLAVLISIVAAAACTEREPPPSGPDPTPQPRGGDTAPDDVKLGYIGVVVPRETRTIVAPLKGQIAEIGVDLGDKVTKGQVLAKVDPKEVLAELEIEKSSLKRSQADVTRTAGTVLTANQAYERDKAALDKKVGTKVEVEASFGRLQESIGQQKGAIASVEQQRNVIARLNEKIKSATLVAEINGRVESIYVHKGDRVEDGRPMMLINSDGDNIVRFAIPGDDVHPVVRGDHVDVVLESEPKPLDAVISAVAPNVEPTAQMIVAEATLSSPPARLSTGRCRVRAKTK